MFYKSNIGINQKGGFCVAKVWFLACKKGVFTLQKYGFCNAKVGILCMLLCHSELQVYVGVQFYGVCRYVYTHKMREGNAYLIMRKHVFVEMDMYIW